MSFLAVLRRYSGECPLLSLARTDFALTNAVPWSCLRLQQGQGNNTNEQRANGALGLWRHPMGADYHLFSWHRMRRQPDQR